MLLIVLPITAIIRECRRPNVNPNHGGLDDEGLRHKLSSVTTSCLILDKLKNSI